MGDSVRRVRPAYSDKYLGNPHKGCCTFQHFNGDPLFPGKSWSEEGPLEFPSLSESPAGGDAVGRGGRPKVIPGYLPTTVSYCRWFWEKLEPEEGRYDFSMVEKSFEVCKERGQTLAVRLMPFGSVRQPQLPAWYLKKYPTVDVPFKSGKLQYPNHDAPQYLEKWGNVLREFGRRFDGHPLLETVDLAYIGPWGEGAGEISEAQVHRFTQVYKEAHPKTPLLVNLDGYQMKAGIAAGMGWRCDCYGDLRASGNSYVRRDLAWNHHFEAYPKQVCETGAQDAWKRAPVHFEACGVPMDWYELGYDLDFILQQGLKFHGTYFMPKYTKLPESWMGALAKFCQQLGYRFALRGALIEASVKPAASVRLQFWIENLGVAPLYHPYKFAVRFRQGDLSTVVPLEACDPREWLPGDTWIDRKVRLPEGFKPGWVQLAAGLVTPGTTEARIQFATSEVFADRWVDLNGFEVEG